jgi:PKD repeat protein
VDSLFWTFPGGFPPFSEQEAPTIAYSTPGKQDVTLQVYVNGASQSITKTNYITVLQDSIWSYPLWESFEGQPSLDGMRWFENSADTSNQWQLTDQAAHSGTWSVLADNHSSNHMTVDELYGPPLDLSNLSQMKLAFKYAFAGVDTATNATKLRIQMTKNCESSWSTRLTLAGEELETVPPQTDPFVPTSTSQWQQAVVNIPSSYLVEGLRFRFAYTSVGNNRLYLDDINVDVTAGIDERASILSDVHLYPNPVFEQLTVSFHLEEPVVLKLSVVKLLGEIILKTQEQKYPAGGFTEVLEAKGHAPGIYLLRLETEDGVVVKRFAVTQ